MERSFRQLFNCEPRDFDSADDKRVVSATKRKKGRAFALLMDAIEFCGYRLEAYVGND